MESMERFHQRRSHSRCTCRCSWSVMNLLLMMVVVMMTDTRPSLALDVNVAVLLPFDDSYMFSYRRVAPAIEKAISYLNSNETPLLWKHRLHVRYADTKCNIAAGMDRAINFFIRREVHVFMGPVCDFSLAPVARQAGFWNIPLISGGAMARDFVIHRNTTYTMLTRVGPVSFGSLSTLLASIFHYNRWRRVKLFYYKDGIRAQDYLMKGFCHLAAEFVVYDLKEREPNLHVDYYRLEETHNLGNVLKEEVGFNFAVTPPATPIAETTYMKFVIIPPSSVSLGYADTNGID